MSDHPGFQFDIAPTGKAWTWTAWDAGRTRRLAGGITATRAQAAAFVVRFITRSLYPDARLPQHRPAQAQRRAA